MKLIGNQSLFHMVWLIFTLVLYTFTSRQFMVIPSIEDFATSQNWLFVTEVCNMVWCGQIKDRII